MSIENAHLQALKTAPRGLNRTPKAADLMLKRLLTSMYFLLRNKSNRDAKPEVLVGMCGHVCAPAECTDANTIFVDCNSAIRAKIDPSSLPPQNNDLTDVPGAQLVVDDDGEEHLCLGTVS